MSADLVQRLRQHDGMLGLLVEEAADYIEALEEPTSLCQRSWLFLGPDGEGSSFRRISFDQSFI